MTAGPMAAGLLCLASLLASAMPAFAATPINETRPLAADGRVSIDNVKGRIVVRGWDRPEVRITGSLGDGVEELEIDGTASALTILVRYPQGGWFGSGNGGEPSTLEVNVPVGATVAIDAVSADVDVSGVRGARLEIDSVSGDTLVREVQPREARMDNVSGDIDAQIDSRDVALETVSGDITLGGRLGGKVATESVSGDLRVSAGTVERLTFATVSGDATMSAALAPGASVRGESVSGNLTLRVPAATSAKLRIESFSGSITSPVGRVITEEYGPGSHLDATLGGGDGEISLEAFSGNARIDNK
jgi:hypothetical protein